MRPSDAFSYILDDDSNKLNFYYISEIIQKDIDGESGTTPE